MKKKIGGNVDADWITNTRVIRYAFHRLRRSSSTPGPTRPAISNVWDGTTPTHDEYFLEASKVMLWTLE